MHYSNPGAALVRRPAGLLCTRHRPITCSRVGGAITVISFVLRFVYAMALCPPVCLSVRHKFEFYRNGRKNGAGFWHAWELPSTLSTVELVDHTYDDRRVVVGRVCNSSLHAGRL